MAETNHENEQSTPHPDLRRLGALIGKWDWRGRSKVGDFEIAGWDTFEWLEGEFFLVERWEFDTAGQPSSGIAITGYDQPSQTCRTHYFDSGGISNSFELEVRDGVLRITWDKFRFEGAFNEAGDTITGTWEQSSDGSAWEYWYDLQMTKVK